MGGGRAGEVDEFTLLCERCGYVLDGIGPARECPECGSPIDASRPERRAGTPWQRGPSWASLLRTWAVTLRRPWRTLGDMRFDRESHPRIVTCAAAALVAIVPAMIATAAGLEEAFEEIPPDVLSALSVLVGGPAAASVFLLLTKFESLGLFIIGRRHGYRLTPAMARTICGHGCVGWLLCAASWWLAWALPWPLGFYGRLVVQVFGAAAGFMFFETFAYMGLRRCRYANRPRPAQAASEPSTISSVSHPSSETTASSGTEGGVMSA